MLHNLTSRTMLNTYQATLEHRCIFNSHLVDSAEDQALGGVDLSTGSSAKICNNDPTSFILVVRVLDAVAPLVLLGKRQEVLLDFLGLGAPHAGNNLSYNCQRMYVDRQEEQEVLTDASSGQAGVLSAKLSRHPLSVENERVARARDMFLGTYGELD